MSEPKLSCICVDINLFWCKMIWTKDHDVLLCREILAEEPYQYKHGSRERGKSWDKIADALNRV